ncbi:hypothetical protein Bhyg_16725, partial [Pseudolycoriella hygida]
EIIVPALIDGIENVILPLVEENYAKKHVEAFAQVCRSAFGYVDTEYKFDSTLRKSDLICSARKFPIGAAVENYKTLEESESSNESADEPEQVPESSHESDTESETDAFDLDDTRFDSDNTRRRNSFTAQ